MVSSAAILLALAGCGSPAVPARNAAKPNFGPPMTDVRTEANIIQMENEYIAAKNSQPTHQQEAEAEKSEKEAGQKAAKEAEEKKAEAGAAKPGNPAPSEGDTQPN